MSDETAIEGRDDIDAIVELIDALTDQVELSGGKVIARLEW